MIDIAYLAGLIDGEGHFTIYTSVNGRGEKHRRALIRVVQHNNNQAEQVFDLIKQDYGGTICYKPKYDMYEWSLYGQQAIQLAKKLEPYLLVKAYQVNRLLGDKLVNGRVT